MNYPVFRKVYSQSTHHLLNYNDNLLPIADKQGKRIKFPAIPPC